RRRHTRSKRDWSSDVCSSDLRLADAVGIGDCSKVVYAGQIEPGNRESPIPSARGDEQLIELEPLAARELEDPLLGLDTCHRRAEPHLDVALSIELEWPQQGLLERHPAAQVVLGERRTVV